MISDLKPGKIILLVSNSESNHCGKKGKPKKNKEKKFLRLHSLRKGSLFTESIPLAQLNFVVLILT